VSDSEQKQSITEEKLGFLNIVILLLSIYVLVALLIDVFVELPPETERILTYVDNIICVFFLVDFVIRFRRAPSKLKFMRWGWIDLISSIPEVDFLRVGRALRLIRIIRILRAFRSMRHIIEHLYRNRSQGALTTVAVLALILIIFSSISILQFEADAPGANIKTAEDALWWSYVTITTIGYGDKFPVTTEGRIVAVILMTAGVGLFGTFTAFVSSWLLADRKPEKSDVDAASESN
jgi:voltage-gated potassium channel